LGVSRSGSVLVDVRPLITAYLSSAAIKLGGYTGFYGYMRPQHPGTTVYLQRLSGSTWGTTAKMALNSTGNYAFTIKPGARGTYTYRVIWLADADHASTWTVAKTFSVS
jgi:serine protease